MEKRFALDRRQFLKGLGGALAAFLSAVFFPTTTRASSQDCALWCYDYCRDYTFICCQTCPEFPWQLCPEVTCTHCQTWRCMYQCCQQFCDSPCPMGAVRR